MKKLTIGSEVYGPYSTVEVLADRYECDGAHLQFSIVGQGVVSDVGPGDFPPPPVDLNALHQSKHARLNEIKLAKLVSTITVSGMAISLDTDSKSILALAKTNSRAGRKIHTQAGDLAILTAAQFDGLVAAIEGFGQSVMDHAYDLSAALDAAVTEAEINAVDVEAGWP